MAIVTDVANGVRQVRRNWVKVTYPELPSVAMPISCLTGRCLLVATIDRTRGIGSVRNRFRRLKPAATLECQTKVWF